MKKFSAILFFLFPIFIYSQDPHFTQFYSSPLQLNPSLAGSSGSSRTILAYRHQWPAISGDFKTANISYDRHLHFIKGGIGLNLMRDVAGEGILKTLRIGLIYSPAFIINEKISIKPSLETTFFQKNIDWSKLTFGDMIDPQYGFIYNTKEVPGTTTKSGVDFSTGILVNGKKWNSGIAIHHLTQPDEGLLGSSKLPRKFTFHGSYIFNRSDSAKFAFAPSVMIMNQGPSTMYLIAVNFRHKKFQWGLGYRAQDAVLLLLGFRGKFFRLGYSFDITISELSTATAGSHEFNLGILFNQKNAPGDFLRIREIAF